MPAPARRPSRPAVRLATLLALGLALVAPAPPAMASYARPGGIEVASVTSSEAQGNGHSGSVGWAGPSLTPDGRYLAFESLATNLVPGDTNVDTDVFVRDRVAGTTERVSISSTGAQGNGPSNAPSISGDGRWVAFVSNATNLAPGGETEPEFPLRRIYLRDRQTGETRFVATGDHPVISADGRSLVYDTSHAVRVYDPVTGKTELVSVSSQGEPANAFATDPAVSADGRIVAFHSTSTNLDRLDQDTKADVYVHDRSTGRTDVVDVTTSGELANNDSVLPTVSGDGRIVAFWSWSTNLVPNQRVYNQLFVHDRYTDVTELVSASTFGEAATEWGWNKAALSHDGRYVAFNSAAPNIVPWETTGMGWDVFVRDRETGTTEIMSVDPNGNQADPLEFGNGTAAISMSADGRLVAFETDSPLAFEDVNGVVDTYVRDRGPDVGIGSLSATANGGSVEVSGWATFSPTTLASVPDITDDAGLGRFVGADIRRAGLFYRPEEGDVFIRLTLGGIPGVPGQFHLGTQTRGMGGIAGVLYGAEFSVGGTTYQARAAGSAEYAELPERHFALFRCAGSCEKVAAIRGGVGTTGYEVWISVPLDALGLQGGEKLAGATAFTAIGDPTTGKMQPLDDAALGSPVVPTASVSLGVAPAGTPEAAVVFDTVASLSNGRFSEALENGGQGGDLWARACLGSSCGSRRVSAP